GLANRRHWLEEVESRLAGNASGAIVICDVDRFKEVNDTLGHAAGDDVLTKVSAILAEHGFAGRLGGDEFALWVDGDLVAGKRAAAGVLVDVDRMFGAGPHRCSVSLGVAASPKH